MDAFIRLFGQNPLFFRLFGQNPNIFVYLEVLFQLFGGTFSIIWKPLISIIWTFTAFNFVFGCFTRVHKMTKTREKIETNVL